MRGNLQYLWRTDDSATLFHRDRRVAWQGHVYCLRLPAPEFDCPRAAAGDRPERGREAPMEHDLTFAARGGLNDCGRPRLQQTRTQLGTRLVDV
jgi:hypothetical protein